jgi:dienelactone hydrolase
MTPDVIAFAEEVVAQGHTVVMPHLFGVPEGAPTPKALAREFAKVCVNKEFTKLALNETAPIADWLRSLARDLHAELGGPGVGAVGMCFTGGFALAGWTAAPAVGRVIQRIAPLLGVPNIMPPTKLAGGPT